MKSSIERNGCANFSAEPATFFIVRDVCGKIHKSQIFTLMNLVKKSPIFEITHLVPYQYNNSKISKHVYPALPGT